MGEIFGRLSSGVPEDEQPLVLPSEFARASGVTPTEDAARWLRRHYPSGVTVVTTRAEDGLFGVTVSAFAFVSLNPLLVLAALGTESQTGSRIRESGVFGVSLLHNKQRFLADRFAGRAPPVDRRFNDVGFVTAATGSPLLVDSIHWIDCAVESIHPGGDHDIYLGKAAAVGHGAGDETDPLVYFDSTYRAVR